MSAAPIEYEWRWIDEKDRAMTEWKRAPMPPVDFVEDERGVMRVQVRMVGEPPKVAPLPPGDAKFAEWLAANQPIWLEFCRLADMMRAKRPNWSARAVLHVLRWNRALRDPTDPLFKINNNWSARMARRYNAERGVEFFRERGSA